MRKRLSFSRPVTKGHGPFALWRYPYLCSLYKRREVAGPEPIRPRSAFINWNFEAELFACSHRLGESNLSLVILKQAFTDVTFYQEVLKNHSELFDSSSDSVKNTLENAHKSVAKIDNTELSKKGFDVAKNHLQNTLRYWYPKFPEEGVQSCCDFLLSDSNLGELASKLGFNSLVRSSFPPTHNILAKCFAAFIGAIYKESGYDRAKIFVSDMMLKHYFDINETWNISNPERLLCKVLKKRGFGNPDFRLLWETGVNTPLKCFTVGVYSNGELIGKSYGESIVVAQEMAARDALRHLFETSEDRAPIPVEKLAILPEDSSPNESIAF